MNTLQSQIDTSSDKVHELQNAFISDVKKLSTNGIEIVVNFAWDGPRFFLRNPELSWNTFVSAELARINSDFVFNFSHGSGAFNDSVSVDERIDCTQSLFAIIKSLSSFESSHQSRLKELYKERSHLDSLYYKLKDEEAKLVHDKCEEELAQTHKKADYDEVLSMLKENVPVTLCFAYRGDVRTVSLRNLGDGRMNLYANDEHATLSYLKSIFDEQTLYYAEPELV